MAFTSTDLDRINAAIASGALEVRFQDRTVKYNSTEDLLKARAVIYNSLNTNVIRQTRISTRKGW